MIYDATKNFEKNKSNPYTNPVNSKKNGAEIDETETKRKTKRINKSNSWLFKKISKTDRPLAQLNVERTQTNRTRNEQENIRSDIKEIQFLHGTILKT